MKKTLTAEQIERRDARRAKFKALWKQVANTSELERIQLANKLGLVSCDGHQLSIGNQMLIALQNPTASVLGGFRQWLKHGRAVRKGQHGAMIWVPTGRKSTIEPTAPGANVITAEETNGENDTRFIIGTVFDIGQTAEIETSSDCMGSQENVETHFNQPREEREMVIA
jgi:hypothetical protein